MIKSSLTVSFIVKLYYILCESRIYFAAKSLMGFLKKVFAGSIFGKLLVVANTEFYRETSVFYKIVGTVIDFIFKVPAVIHEYSKSGLLYRGIHFLLSKSKILKTENMAVILLGVMFICPHELWNNVYGLIIAAALAGMYIISAINREGFRKNAKAIWLPMILFVIAIIYSVIVSHRINDSIRVMMFFITSFILCLVCFGMLSSKERFDKMCLMLYIAMIITGLVAIYQRIAGIEVDPSLTDVYLNAGMPGRAFSTWENPNNYAQFLIIFFPFCFSFTVTRKSLKTRVIATALLIIPFAALLLTYSRSGWLGFALAFMTYALLYNKKLVPFIVILIICAIPLMPQTIINRILTIGNLQDSSSAYRVNIWTGAMSMIEDYWKTGTGLGPEAFKAVYSVYGIGSSKIAPHTHMLFMEIMAEMGIVGLLSFSAWILSLIVRSCKCAAGVKSGEMKAYTIAAAASMAGILIIGFAEYVWFYPRVMFAFFVAIGMAMAAIKNKSKD